MSCFVNVVTILLILYSFFILMLVKFIATTDADPEGGVVGLQPTQNILQTCAPVLLDTVHECVCAYMHVCVHAYMHVRVCLRVCIFL